MRVGFVGIGNMGRPMAVNVLKAGHAVVALDSEPARAERLALEHGASAAQRPEELGSVEFVITMLPTGTVCIDMSSSDPAGTRALGAELRGIGLILLDAPVSGAVPRAQSGTLTIMIGGDDASAIERAKPLLAAMGNRLFEAGSLGCGHALKALNNLVAAAAFTATAEALLIGKRFGLDPARMIEVMNVSTARNFHTDVVMSEHVIGGKFATGFALGLLAKDVQIAADLARQVRLDAPLSRLVNARWAHARDRLGPQRDNSEAILSWDESLSE